MTNNKFMEIYVLYQCGVFPPLKEDVVDVLVTELGIDIAKYASPKYFSIPLQRVGVTATTPVAMMVGPSSFLPASPTHPAPRAVCLARDKPGRSCVTNTESTVVCTLVPGRSQLLPLCREPLVGHSASRVRQEGRDWHKLNKSWSKPPKCTHVCA